MTPGAVTCATPRGEEFLERRRATGYIPAMAVIELRILLFGMVLALTGAGCVGEHSKAASEKAVVIAECVDQLVAMQEEGGMWPYEGRYRIEGNIPVPYQVGGTSLVCMALLYGADGEDSRARPAFQAGLKFVLSRLDHPQMIPAKELKYDMRVLGQAYALLLLCHVQVKGAAGVEETLVDEWIPRLVKSLVFEQMTDGGWNYQGRPVHASFVTSSVVQALLWANAGGQKIPPAVFGRARDALVASRIADGAFYYFGTRQSAKARQRQDRLPGSAARSAICETMLHLLGAGSTERIRGAIEAFHTHWGELEKRRKKPGTHEGPYLIAPYYFYYGHRYAAQAIELLPAPVRAKERNRLFELLLRTRDPDGTWNDRAFPRSRNYGTAMVLLALLSDKIGPPPPYRGRPDEGGQCLPEKPNMSQ